jgi:hypothetical protein
MWSVSIFGKFLVPPLGKDKFSLELYTRLHCFKYEFSNIFWGGAHRAPSPDPSPRFFSGFALGSGFALNSQALRAFDSGFALDSRASRSIHGSFAPSIRGFALTKLALNFLMKNLV